MTPNNFNANWALVPILIPINFSLPQAHHNLNPNNYCNIESFQNLKENYQNESDRNNKFEEELKDAYNNENEIRETKEINDTVSVSNYFAF